MGDQQYVPLLERAKRTDKGLRQTTGNLSTFSGRGRKMKVEKKRSEKQEEEVPKVKKRISKRKK